MRLYSRYIFPWLCDLVLDRPRVAEHRRTLLANVGGDVLEVGFGTGLNLPHYPPQVRRIMAVDPNERMLRKARKRIERSGIEVDQRRSFGEQKSFDDGAFDCVISTFTLCSVDDPRRVIREIHRVLKPGGRFLLLEHGLSPDPNVRKWQRRLNPLERLLGDGCRLDRDMRAIVASQPFEKIEIENFHLERTPPTHGYLFRGVATKSR
ncbi:MAG: class I SAM-dependent methyltransferase [Planctomycetaceae bacterium]